MYKQLISTLIAWIAVASYALTFSPELLQKAENGDAAAQYNLAECYASGLGIEKNDNEALKYYIQAANQDYSDAQHELGWWYFNGTCVDENILEAKKWFERGANNGDVACMRALGIVYYLGFNGKAYPDEAFRLWDLVEKSDNAEEIWQLGNVFFGRFAAIETLDRRKSVALWLKAAEMGYYDAQCDLAYQHILGENVVKNYKEAYFWYLIASVEGEEWVLEARDETEEKLSPQAREEVQEKATKWLEQQ